MRFALFNELLEHIVIKINTCNMHFHDSTWVESKVHLDYDLWCILEGKVTIETGGGRYSATAGDIILFYPDIPYKAYANGGACSFIYTHFNFSIGNNFKVLNEFEFAGIVPGQIIAEEAELFKKWFRQYQKKQAISALMLQGAFTLLVAKILSLNYAGRYTQTFSNPALPQKAIATRSMLRLEPVLKHISEHIDKAIRVTELAAIAGMSDKYFIQFFKKILGISPGHYINQVKMNRARDYLYQRKFSVKEISGMLGYPDPASFTKAFKKHYQVPPSRFIE